ncbi:MAG: hypothetical protein AABW88_00720 [Nanoarchaeota archaeon]
MEVKTTGWIIIAVLLLSVIFTGFSRSSNPISGNAVNNGKLDTTGWTENEKMNYDMHGTIPARVKGSSQSSGSGMVGGC